MRRCLPLVFALISILFLALSQAQAAESVTLDQYKAHLESIQALAQGCRATAQACDPKAVGEDDNVQLHGLGVGANANSVEVHYDWLRNALAAARTANDEARAARMQAASARIEESLRDISSAAPATTDLVSARRKTNTILGREEFATVRSDSIWDRLAAHLVRWLDSFFNHMAAFGKRSPWIGPLMEWGLIVVVLLALAVWAMRALRRQRLAVRVEAQKQIEPWEEAARNWRALAEEQAAKSNWREAVHCLYWASIALLEGRRLWAPNRSRTPREYVRLLETGSPRWRLLRQQTQGFERVWYGLNYAARQDYEHALELHEGLRAA